MRNSALGDIGRSFTVGLAFFAMLVVGFIVEPCLALYDAIRGS